MKTSVSTLALVAALALPGAAFAQDKNVKIGVLDDMSGLYADVGGQGSILAAQMAIEDSGMVAKGWKIDLISADHQNKPDVGVNLARQWADQEKVDGIFGVLTSSVALAVNGALSARASAGTFLTGCRMLQLRSVSPRWMILTPATISVRPIFRSITRPAGAGAPRAVF